MKKVLGMILLLFWMTLIFQYSAQPAELSNETSDGWISRLSETVSVILGIGSEAYTPNQIMSVNETGAFLWNLLEKGAEKPELVDALTKEYEVNAETAEKDVEAFLTQLREKALIEE